MVNGKFIKKIVTMTLVIAITGSLMLGNGNFSYVKAAVVKTTNQKEQEKTDYIVKVKNQNKIDTVKQEYKESNEINENAEGALEDNSMVSVELSNKEVKEIESREDIEFIEKDYSITACQNIEKKKHDKKEKRLKKNNSDYEWNVRMIHADNKAVDVKEHVKVAVIDSGIDWGNDINLVYQESLVPGEEGMTQVFMDGNGHGSSVASLIAATDDGEGITGINPNVDIYSYRVLGDDNSAPVSRVVEAIYMAIEQEVNIINMSFGLSDYSNALEQAIKDAKAAGILIIAAAGNTGDEGVVYPAAFEEVVAVGAVNKDGDIEDYSAKGDEVEVVAPGEKIKTTGFMGSEEVVSGTSLASPQVCALASLIWQKDMSVSADFVRGLIQESSNLYGDKEKYGNGLIDVSYALKEYDEYKKRYKTKSKYDKLIKENKKDIITFDNTGCVEGMWSQDDHESLINKNFTYVRKGIRFPDINSYKDKNGDCIYATITKNPWWHGSYNTNYIMAFEYATKLADKIGNLSKWSKDKVSCVNSVSTKGYSHASKVKDDVKKLVNYLDDSALLKGTAKTPGKIRAIIWGMAIHSATDVYAHSVFVGNHHLDHETKVVNGKKVPKDEWAVADDKTEYSCRYYEDAANVAIRCMDKYKQNKSGDYTVFYVNGSNGPKWYKIKDIVANVTEAENHHAGNMFKNYNY